MYDPTKDIYDVLRFAYRVVVLFLLLWIAGDTKHLIQRTPEPAPIVQVQEKAATDCHESRPSYPYLRRRHE